MSDPGAAAYAALTRDLRETALFASAAGVLGWDQETMLPPRGGQLRAEQLAALSGLVHERFTRPQVGEWLAACEADPALAADARAAANLREVRREYDRSVRLPGELVRNLAQTTALSQQAWRDARERSDFRAFAPWLQQLLQLSRSKADCLLSDTSATRYDALMDAYEPDASAARLSEVFGALRERLAPLIAEIAASSTRPSTRVRRLQIPIPQQQALSRLVVARMGFDLDAGRLDTSTHPFCEGIGPGDTRLTTRYTRDNFPDALSSTMHEAGHGLYEQGLPKAEHFGEPLAEAASLGIHESQSRLWENFIGRSHAFWRWALPEASRLFGGALDGVEVGEVYGAVNAVEPNLIRVDSDEATYNLHIMLRFDLERALLDGDLPVEDLAGEWNRRVQADLGLAVPDDRRGCLQDIHWSMGAIGYFPTYTLGNLYAAQMWEAITRAVPGVEEQLAGGDFGAVLGWLRENIHAQGRLHSADELCRRTTGAPLSADPFVRYLEDKLRPLYGL